MKHKKLSTKDKIWLSGYLSGRQSIISEIVELLAQKEELLVILKQASEKYPVTINKQKQYEFS